MTRRFSPSSRQSKSNHTRHLGGAFLCLLVLAAGVSGARASSAEAPAVENVVVAGESGALTVEITTSVPQPPEFQTYIYQRPDRLIIDLTGFVWKQGRTAHLSAGSGGVDTIRVGQHRSDPPSTRIVFDLYVSPDQLSYETIETGDSGGLVFEFAPVAGVAAPQPAPVETVAPALVAPEPEEEASTTPAPQEATSLEPEQETAIAAAMAAASPPPPAAASVSNSRKIIGWVLVGVAVVLLIAARWRWFCDLAFGQKPHAVVAETAPAETAPVETAPADAVETKEEELAEDADIVVAASDGEPLPIEEVRPETKELPMVAAEEVEASEAESPVVEEGTAEPVVEVPVAEEMPAQPVETPSVAVSPPSPAALVGELPEGDPDTKMAVLARLKERMSEEHGLLLPLLKDSDPKVRAAVAEAVGELRATEYAGALAAALGDPDREVRISVLRAFEGLGEAASYYVDYVRSRLADPDPLVRAQATEAVAAMTPVPESESTAEAVLSGTGESRRDAS